MKGHWSRENLVKREVSVNVTIRFLPIVAASNFIEHIEAGRTVEVVGVVVDGGTRREVVVDVVVVVVASFAPVEIKWRSCFDDEMFK